MRAIYRGTVERASLTLLILLRLTMLLPAVTGILVEPGIENVQTESAALPLMTSLHHLDPVAGRGQCGCAHQEAASPSSRKASCSFEYQNLCNVWYRVSHLGCVEVLTLLAIAGAVLFSCRLIRHLHLRFITCVYNAF